MNIDDYESQHERSYEVLAAAVELMLKNAIKDAASACCPRIRCSRYDLRNAFGSVPNT